MFVWDLCFSLLVFIDSLRLYTHIVWDFYAMYIPVRHTVFIIIIQCLSITCNLGQYFYHAETEHSTNLKNHWFSLYKEKAESKQVLGGQNSRNEKSKIIPTPHCSLSFPLAQIYSKLQGYFFLQEEKAYNIFCNK